MYLHVVINAERIWQQKGEIIAGANTTTFEFPTKTPAVLYLG
jgi:hypothetical protein